MSKNSKKGGHENIKASASAVYRSPVEIPLQVQTRTIQRILTPSAIKERRALSASVPATASATNSTEAGIINIWHAMLTGSTMVRPPCFPSLSTVIEVFARPKRPNWGVVLRSRWKLSPLLSASAPLGRAPRRAYTAA